MIGINQRDACGLLPKVAVMMKGGWLIRHREAEGALNEGSKLPRRRVGDLCIDVSSKAEDCLCGERVMSSEFAMYFEGLGRRFQKAENIDDLLAELRSNRDLSPDQLDLSIAFIQSMADQWSLCEPIVSRLAESSDVVVAAMANSLLLTAPNAVRPPPRKIRPDTGYSTIHVLLKWIDYEMEEIRPHVLDSLATVCCEMVSTEYLRAREEPDAETVDQMKHIIVLLEAAESEPCQRLRFILTFVLDRTEGATNA